MQTIPAHRAPAVEPTPAVTTVTEPPKAPAKTTRQPAEPVAEQTKED